MKAMKLSTLAAAVALASPFAANAESNFTTGGGANITATARVNFSVDIPKFVFLQVGTGGHSWLPTQAIIHDHVQRAGRERRRRHRHQCDRR